MPVARSGAFWRGLSLALFIAATVLYLWDRSREFPHGGSPVGLGFGIAGAVLILLLASFGIRKRAYRSTLGTVEQWLESHIYLGVLALVLLLYHSAGHFDDHVAAAALLLVAIVVGSGIVGAVLYATVPRALTEAEGKLTADEISDRLNELAKQMARVASGRSAALQRACDELIEASRPRPLAGWRLLFSRRNWKDAGTRPDLLQAVPPGEQEELRQLLIASRERNELLGRLVRQERYRNLLEVWIYVHVPFTLALLLFAAVHVIAVLYYGKVLS